MINNFKLPFIALVLAILVAGCSGSDSNEPASMPDNSASDGTQNPDNGNPDGSDVELQTQASIHQITTTRALITRTLVLTTQTLVLTTQTLALTTRTLARITIHQKMMRLQH